LSADKIAIFRDDFLWILPQLHQLRSIAMTATLITFPDAIERADREFECTGTTPYLRALDEADVLWAATWSREFLCDFHTRLAKLGVTVRAVLRDRPELAGEIAILNGGTMLIPFGDMPLMISGLAGRARAAND
jgi:hypothetical protein